MFIGSVVVWFLGYLLVERKVEIVNLWFCLCVDYVKFCLYCVGVGKEINILDGSGLLIVNEC